MSRIPAKNNTTTQLLIVDPNKLDGMPFWLETERLDQWPSSIVTSQMIENIISIFSLGFVGAKVQAPKLEDGREFLYCSFDLTTPEGKISKNIMRFAKEGVSVSLEEVIAILERLYREQGLELPYAKDTVQ